LLGDVPVVPARDLGVHAVKAGGLEQSVESFTML